MDIFLDCNLIENPSTIKIFFGKTKIKSYHDEFTDFHDKEIPKLGSNYTCLAVILVGFVLKKDENYHPQMFLKEFLNTLKKKKKVARYINNDLQISSDDSCKE